MLYTHNIQYIHMMHTCNIHSFAFVTHNIYIWQIHVHIHIHICNIYSFSGGLNLESCTGWAELFPWALSAAVMAIFTSSSSLKFSHSPQHGHLFTSLRNCTEQSRTLRNALAQASQACSGPAEEAILEGRLSPVSSVGSFCFCSLQEVWVFTSHPHKTRWLPRKPPPPHLAFSNKEFHFSQQTALGNARFSKAQ